jgi:hypothetical protein
MLAPNASVSIGGRQEKHVALLDESAIVVSDVSVVRHLFETIGDTHRIELVLQVALPVVINA